MYLQFPKIFIEPLNIQKNICVVLHNVWRIQFKLDLQIKSRIQYFNPTIISVVIWKSF